VTRIPGLALAAAIALFAMMSGGRAFAADDYSICYATGEMAASYKDSKSIQPAIAACTRMIASGKYAGKPLSRIYSARGSWRTKADELDEALKDFAAAIKLDPGYVEFYDYRADVWQKKKNYERAIADYDQAILLDPKYAAAYYSRGYTYQLTGDTEKARENYNLALRQPPRDRIAEWAHENARKRLEEMDAKK
jgi:tetratricopeptide (TPR) repeat protein